MYVISALFENYTPYTLLFVYTCIVLILWVQNEQFYFLILNGVNIKVVFVPFRHISTNTRTNTYCCILCGKLLICLADSKNSDQTGHTSRLSPCSFVCLFVRYSTSSYGYFRTNFEIYILISIVVITK